MGWEEEEDWENHYLIVEEIHKKREVRSLKNEKLYMT